MTIKIEYDVYRGAKDRTLRLATMPGAGLPSHLNLNNWVLIRCADIKVNWRLSLRSRAKALRSRHRILS
jgi:hypothetical protein